jgi:fatty-acyl-CoA synthase
MVNLSAHIRYHAVRFPGRLALVYEDQRIGYSDFDDRLRAMAGFLRQHGVGTDEVVAVLMKNSAAFLEIAFAVSHIGAVFLPINFRLASDEVEYIVGNAGAVLMFVDEELVEVAANVTPKVVVDTPAQRDSRALSASSPRVEATVRGPNDLFRLMYTSGTTDRPKGVAHVYENFYWKCWDQIADLDLLRCA